MSQDQERKINYKILTDEHLLKEESASIKEIQYPEEKINVSVFDKIESLKEISTTKSPEEIKEKKELLEIQPEAGLIYPKMKEENEKIIKKTEMEIQSEPEIFKESETSFLKSQSEVKEEVKEEPYKGEIFYIPKKENELQFKPSSQFLEKEDEDKNVFKEITQTKFQLPPNLFRFILPAGGIVLILFLILFLKPQEKFKTIFKADKEIKTEEVKTEIETEIAIPEKSVISFPTVTSTSLNEISRPTFVTTSVTETSISTTSFDYSQTFSLQSQSTTFEEIFFLKNFSSKDIILQKLDFSVFQEELEKFISLQDVFGSKINVNFLLYNKNKISFDFLFDYFIKPTKISSTKIDDFKNNLSGNYGFLIYYGYTRKYPILIFEVKNKDKAVSFNQEWEKLTMREDLKTLFLGLEPPKTKNNFVTKNQGKYSYRLLDFGDNFKIIWAIADNYLIYSTTEAGIKEIFSFLQ